MAQVKERGGAGEERKEKVSFPFPSPYPLFHFLVLVSFLVRSKPKISFHGLFLLRNQTETLATRTSLSLITPGPWTTLVPPSFPFQTKWLDRHLARLRVVPHLSSEIVERAKIKTRLCVKNHLTGEKATRVSPFSRGVIFTRARVSLALLSLRKNGGLLVV